MSSTPRHIEFTAGEMIFRQGYPADNAYIITSGEVEIFNANPDGSESQIAILHAGEMFGELGVLDDAPRSASARARSDCVLQIMEI